MDYKNICFEVRGIAYQAGEFIRNERLKLSAKDVVTKSTASFVTYVDKTSEQFIVKELSKLLPEAGFITEEETVKTEKEKLMWVIDPLDGTTNYIHGISPHSVSIALMENDEPVIGVVYEIGLDEMFYAWKGSWAYLNDKVIKVSESSKHEDTLIATGFPYYDFDKIENYIDVLRFLMRNTRGLRRMGSAAVDLAYVAAGRFDAFYEHALHAWDVAAGVLIVQQAGGKVTDFNGGENWLFGGEIIAANKNYFNAFYKIVNQHLGTGSRI
ncbi:MAG: inositol monophosphatase [Prolixibacteraceae bacterium]|nr:inositol monophosphatase [Prolixibacteraceae bacterium]MBN2773920.1 inositol monophosphatase [Prolixibacteraceae bacterium]